MQTTATAPRRTSLDDFIRLTTEPVAPVFAKSVCWERAAVAEAAARGDALSTVFASFPFVKAGI